MNDESKTKKQLIEELVELRKKVVLTDREDADSNKIQNTLSLLFDALNSSPNGVILTDLGGRIVYANASFLQILGYRNKNEISGRNAVELFPSQKIKKFSDLGTIINKADGLTEELIVERKGGKKIPVEVSSSIIRNHKGKTVGKMTSFRDISDKYRLKKGLRRVKRNVRILSSKLMESEEKQKHMMARELHDGVGARLTAIKFALEEKLSFMDKEKVPQGDISLEQIVAMVRDTIEETHKISTNLRPSLLDDLGIITTIHSVCREYQGVQSDIQLKHKIKIKEDEIPESLKIVIFRVLQEALNNALKHSRAGTVCVSLKRTGRFVEFSVEDDGKGFDEEKILSEESQTGGMGLGSMKERTELSNGSFEIQSKKGNGTKISARWRL